MRDVFDRKELEYCSGRSTQVQNKEELLAGPVAVGSDWEV